MKKITAALIGAGGRGVNAYASYALSHPYDMQVVAVAEPDEARRENFKKLHGIPDEMCFTDWKDLLDKPKLADAIMICTQDKMHYEPTIKALDKGYHILLEKPMSPDPKECIIMGEHAKAYNKIFLICHVLRYTRFFSTLKNLLDAGRIGRLITIQHNENVGHVHHSHSYVRGAWRNTKESSPMILAKSCHDMDILLWLTDSECINLSSFGTLSHFKKENAPEGAPHRCLDGCPHEAECQYFAPKIYLTTENGWPASAITNDLSMEGRIKALKEGPYGRCVYHCDNDVVDHQVVNLEFANEVTAVFTMSAFSKEISRTIKLMGTKGEIRGAMEKNEIEIHDFSTGDTEVISLKEPEYGHSGGDAGIMQSFVKQVRDENSDTRATSAMVSVQSHILAFAAEKSRIEKRVVKIKDYITELKNDGIS